MTTSQRLNASVRDETMPALPGQPELSSSARQWDGIIFEKHTVEPGELPEHVLAQHCFLLPVGNTPVPYNCRIDGQRVSGHMEPYKIQFRTAGSSVSSAWTSTLHGIFFALAPSAISLLLGPEASDRGAVLISDLDPKDNPVLVHLTLAMDAHLRTQGVRGRLFEQSLLAAICANLLQSYGKHPAAAPAGSLPRHVLGRVHAFIQANLGRQFSVEDIARAACMSPYHLSRAYRRTTGLSLWQHVLQCRAEAARDLMLRHADMPLAQVALSTGFESYAQFIAAFRKYQGMLPSRFRRLLVP